MIPFLLLASLTTVVPVSRPSPRPDMIVTAAWLRTHVNDPNLVVLDLTMPDMGSPDPYESGHIPGARKLDFHSIFTGDGSNGTLTMQMVPPDSLRRVLEALGVSDGSTIVLYSTSRWISPVARTYVTLDYLGLGDRTRILDGGYDAWKAAGGASEMVAPKFARGSLHVTARGDVVTDGAYVRAHIGDRNMTIVDARAPEFYNGSVQGHSAARVGHVPGARNVYFLTLADSATSVYLTPEQARARFTAAGVPLDKPVVVYCHIGQTASVDYVQLRRLGVPVRLYDGSFEDWSRPRTTLSFPAWIGSRIRPRHQARVVPFNTVACPEQSEGAERGSSLPSAEPSMPLPLDPAFPADHSVIDEFNRHEEKRDYWYGRARAIEEKGGGSTADSSRTTAREYRNRLDCDDRRLSDAYRKAYASDIHRVLAGN